LPESNIDDFGPINAEKISETIEKIDQALAGKEVSKKVRQKLNYAKKYWPDKLQEDEQKEEVLKGRNS
jgi:hypothetical protein